MAAAAASPSVPKRARRASHGGRRVDAGRPPPPPPLTRAEVKLPALDHVLVEYDSYTPTDGYQTHIRAFNFPGLRVFLENWSTDQLHPFSTPENSIVMYLARQTRSSSIVLPGGQYDAELHAPMFYVQRGNIHGKLSWTLPSWSTSRYYYGPSLTAVQLGTYATDSDAGEYHRAAADNPTPETFMVELPVEVDELMRWVRGLAVSVDQLVRAEVERRQAIAAEAHDALVSDLYGEVNAFLGYYRGRPHSRRTVSSHKRLN